MIDLYQLYLSFLSYVNTFQGGWFRPQSDFQRACNDISNNLWNDWTGQAEKSKEVKDNLIYFLKSVNRKVDAAKGAYGIFNPPANYGRCASVRYITDGTKIIPSPDVNNGECDGFKSEEEITENYYENIVEIGLDDIDNKNWAAVIAHKTKFPTLANPKMTQINSGFKVAPREISVVVLDYYIKPRDAIFGYTVTPGNLQTGAGDQIVYDINLSLPLQWPTTMINEFLARLGERFGIFTRDQLMIQFSTQQKKTA